MSPPRPDGPHRRFNPLTGRWVLVSPQRAARPWLGQEEPAETARRVHLDPSCHLCPGALRATGERNPEYRGVHIFDNDFPAVLPEADADAAGDALFRSQPAVGTARVICFSHDHALTLPELDDATLRELVDCWCSETEALGRTHEWVQVFENKGAMMGCSNPHPHGQIWATHHLPDEPAAEDARQRAWFDRTGGSMLLEVAEREARDGARIVEISPRWIAITPYWAVWPFETLVLPRFPVSRLPDLAPDDRAELAQLLRALTTRYDNLFECAFPYSMGWHGAPFDGRDPSPWQLHAHFYPPLLRSRTVRKFMVGYEMLAEAQRDLTPEQAAARLRAVPATHYRSR